VSTIWMGRSSDRCAIPVMRSRVIPGRSWTIACRRPSRRLNSVDLPTLGRPTMAAVGVRGMSGIVSLQEVLGGSSGVPFEALTPLAPLSQRERGEQGPAQLLFAFL